MSIASGREQQYIAAMKPAPTQRQTSSEIVSGIKDTMCSESGLKLAVLYGSAANGTLRPGSDVDLALLFDRPMTPDLKMRLIQRLERALLREVDLVDLYDLNGTLLRQILRKGQVLLRPEPSAMTGLVQRMIYNQTDMMPYVSRALLERQRRFVHGS